ncbi:hypothetical protein NA57DRAFT_33432 [Rhizodiscina lignyota]|uniref:F-box domain-containing protein n=1 Tax=Rhizodiscina lignyota TaxID=1504668 RepID=A0A9P4IL20_9PEZI|nr:hypothetical protein NA57DRAFT_33432 [Rhizodiscina lignyota]
MQPELTEVSNSVTSQQLAPCHPQPSQHGRSGIDDELPPSPHAGAGSEDFQQFSTADGLVDSDAHRCDSSSLPATTRLKNNSTPPRDRISEYENAISSSPTPRGDSPPAFEVRKKHWKLTDTASPVNQLPNEVLTHALSHLSPSDLASVALVSRRFHNLVTTQHAWRAAFARYFPGAESARGVANRTVSVEDEDVLPSEKRAFTRLSALATWRSEYMIRTRLLRSLSRGKPMQHLAPPSSSRSGQSHTANATVMYNSQLLTTINHLHATFGTGLNKRVPRVVHGADDVGTASSSDPMAGKADNWGLSDPQLFLQFSERFPGDAQWGLGPGEVIGVPNVMDVSHSYGMVHGEGSPGGSLYYRSVEEMRGRFLLPSLSISDPELGIPKIDPVRESICSVWMAKSQTLPSMSEGLIGILSGSSAGVVSAYSLGSDGLRSARMTRGELTARWVLSPGVPIIGIAVDDSYSIARRAQNRIWAVALNALGELFYLTQIPRRSIGHKAAKLDDPGLERLAWSTGRTVYWNVVEPSRRNARPNPYQSAEVDGSYSPRSSWNGMCLSTDQIVAETREIEAFLSVKPKDFQKRCTGWDMRRRMEVDFAGDDGNLAGEAIAVFKCGLDEGSHASIQRYLRYRFEQEEEALLQSTVTLTPANVSLFGNGENDIHRDKDLGDDMPSLERLSSRDGQTSPPQRRLEQEWRQSTFSFDTLKSLQIMTTAIDSSNFATLTQGEDPLLNAAGLSNASSPWASPVLSQDNAASPSDIPGQRARFVAAGTDTGVILLWDIRAAPPRSSDLINTIEPVRIIYTDSPQISCLALTALYLVHGGNDGLVQAWDVLASTTTPIRTLNSRFSSRARRRLIQAQASPQGIGINLFAAGAVVLDPDPTSLRGIVTLGTHLKFWAFSSSAADQYKSSKRRLRRSERGSNSAGPGSAFSGAGRGSLKDYIANEKLEMEHDREARRRESERLTGRFGVNMLGSEEEALAYAAMLSQESLASEERKRRESGTSSAAGIATPTEGSVSVASARGSPQVAVKNDDELDADIAEAIRQSLETSTPSIGSPALEAHSAPAATPSPQLGATASGPSNAQEMKDLEFALQLSMAEEESRKDAKPDGDVEEAEEFPSLNRLHGKGKRRA